MEKTNVKVGNVHRDATSALLRSFFEFHGHILRAQIKETPEMRCGFVEFSDASAAMSALLFDRSSFVGQQITVELCDEPMTDEEVEQEVEGGGATSETSEDFEKVEMQDAPEPAALEAEAAALEARKTPRSSPAKPAATEPAALKSCLKPPARPSSPGAQLDRLMGLAAQPPQASSSLLSLLELPSFACFRKVLREPINDVRAVLGVTLVGLAALALY